MVVADFRSLYYAWQQCRRRKSVTPQAQRYELHLLDNLITTVQALEQESWQPAPPVCFAVSQPKAREIHAAAFTDRVVHHWLVPRLEVLFEPIFIHDVYSNRKGKGTHTAVKRLQGFMRSIRHKRRCMNRASAELNKIDRMCDKKHVAGYFLQLDIKNFFNSVDLPILFQLIQHRLRKAMRCGQITTEDARFLRNLVHTILKQDIGKTSVEIGDQMSLMRIPPHKRLANAGYEKGLPIGNLTSQFFANVYLNELDQFVKHRLKCKHYLRYVDDFVLLHPDQHQLRAWEQRIENFLAETLKLQLRDRSILKPFSSGADFLGYVVRPNYCLVRRRVIGNLNAKLHAYSRTLLCKNRAGETALNLPWVKREQLQAMLASYLGHFSHAHCHALLGGLLRRHVWLNMVFSLRGHRLLPRWEPASVSSYRSQCNWFRRQFPAAHVTIQRGCQTDIFSPWQRHHPIPGDAGKALRYRVKRIVVREQGYLKGGLKRRVLEKATLDCGINCIAAI